MIAAFANIMQSKPATSTPSPVPSSASPKPAMTAFQQFKAAPKTAVTKALFKNVAAEVNAKNVAIANQQKAIGGFQQKIDTLQSDTGQGGFNPQWIAPIAIAGIAIFLLMFKKR